MFDKLFGFRSKVSFPGCGLSGPGRWAGFISAILVLTVVFGPWSGAAAAVICSDFDNASGGDDIVVDDIVVDDIVVDAVMFSSEAGVVLIVSKVGSGVGILSLTSSIPLSLTSSVKGYALLYPPGVFQ